MNATITAIIVDDEPDARMVLQSSLNQSAPEVKVVAKAKNAQDGLLAIMDHYPDLVFLDIQMPEHDGFWLAEKMKDLKHQSYIVFVTAYDKFAIEAFKYAAFDFLTKPVVPEHLRQVIDRFKKVKNDGTIHHKLEDLHYFLNHSKIKFNTYDGFVMIKAEEIVYCTADRNYSKVFLHSGEDFLVAHPLLHLEQELHSFSFVRISRSCLVNLNYVDRFYRKTKNVVLKNEFKQITLKASSSGAKRLMEF